MNPDIEQISQKLIAYLRGQLHAPTIAYKAPLTQLQGGFETHVYRFRLKGAVQRELLEPLILRLYPEYYGSGNAVWESTVQNVLAAEGYPVAKARLVCTDTSILGGAFFIMDFLPGKPLVTEPTETIPELLGKAHAALHSIDPKPLLKSLAEQSVEEHTCRLDYRLARLQEKTSTFPWLREAVDWLVENRPPEPEQLAICHGDFHPLNILVQEGKVTGVLDWPGFLVADPALDVGNTLVLITISARHLGPALGLDFASLDIDLFEQWYLDAYGANNTRCGQGEKSLDKSHLAYYRVRRCVHACVEGAAGQSVWRHPPILSDVLGYIDSVTGIKVIVPG